MEKSIDSYFTEILGVTYTNPREYSPLSLAYIPTLPSLIGTNSSFLLVSVFKIFINIMSFLYWSIIYL